MRALSLGNRIAIESEQWLKLVCVLVSVLLHIGLGLAGWQGLRSMVTADQAIMVALVERPAPARGKPLPGPVGARSPKPAVAPRPPAVKPVSAVAAPTKHAQAVAPVIEAAEPSVSDAELATGEASTDSGDGSGNGWGGGQSKALSPKNAEAFIKATSRKEFNATPVYPDIARENHWAGTVTVKARVTAIGDVEGVTLERSSGQAMLDRSALDAVRQWRFIPATRNGVPVESDVSVQVPFPPKE